MNVVIKNQNDKILDSLTIDVIKTLTGEFDRNTIEPELFNLLYNKIIIDITAIKNFYDIKSVINFLSFFEPTKVIILLNDSELINSNNYLANLVQNGFYNFTRNAAGINYLLNTPNTVREVEKYLNFNYEDDNQKPVVNQNTEFKKDTNCKVIGLQNLTDHSGATTLMYMMVKQLKNNYKVKGIEMFKQDSIYFTTNDLSICLSINDLKMRLNSFKDEEVIIVDLNDLDDEGICDEILYLVEPGTIRLNKLIKKNNQNSYMNKGKIILNRSAIKDDELSTFEYETKLKVFLNIPNFNERKDRIEIIDKLLIKLGFKKQQIHAKGLFGRLFQ